jgi:prevent-host-death family protein
MQIMTAKDAKTRFGEALDTMQREPILLTKNSRPVGIMVSLDDLKGTYLADLFAETKLL